MARISDLIDIGTLKLLLSHYSGFFSTPVFLFDENGKLLLSSPGASPGQELFKKPLLLRGSFVGQAAVPVAASRSLDFIVKNLSIILEKDFEIESLSSEVARNYEEFTLLWNLSSRLGAVLDVEKVCAIAAGEIMNVCPSKAVAIFLAGNISSDVAAASYFQPAPHSPPNPPEQTQTLFPTVVLGEYSEPVSRMKLNTNGGLVGRVFHKKEALTVDDVSTDQRFEGFPYPVRRLLIVPLTVEDRPIGVIIATDKLDNAEFYSTEIKTVSSIASESAVSIKKALLFSEIRSLLFSTAEAFSFAIEAKDPYTYGHSKRVAELSVKIARLMGIADDILDWVRLAALLHDIGKIGMPEDILHKDKRLNLDEMSKVKEHPIVGAKVIEPIKKLSEVAKWIYSHHEKYDGSGYPDGIAGDTIPLPSRIISIADNFDALTSDRPYKKASSAGEAVKIMREFIGEHFDPVLFRYFEAAIGVRAFGKESVKDF